MKRTVRPQRIQTTSVDSRLDKQSQFENLLSKEVEDNIKGIDRTRYSYTIELLYPSQATRSWVHYQIAYKVISRNIGSATVIKVKTIVCMKSKLRLLIKRDRWAKRILVGWVPRLKTR
ncbi:MAG: hypothetical protein RIQ84_950 [Pseudomonadota bacterium]|jgi:hypothetical protein